MQISAERIDAARKVTGKPLTLTEKILYAHLWQGNATGKAFERGKITWTLHQTV
jgi:aconitate hydratase